MKNADSERKIEGRALLPHIRRGEIDDDALHRKGAIRVFDGRRDPLTALLHGIVRQPHDDETRDLILEMRLDGDDERVDAIRCGGEDFREHG